MADNIKTEEVVTSEEVVADPVPAAEPTAEPATTPAAPQQGQIDYKFFKRVQWGLTAATVFCGAAGFTVAYFEDKERDRQATPAPVVAPVTSANPVTPLVRAPG